MPTTALRSCLLAALGWTIIAPCATTHAQARVRPSADYLFRPGNVTLTLSAGGAAFTDFQQDPARVLTTAGSGSAGGASGPTPEFTRRISAQTTATGAAALSVWVSRTLAIQLESSFTPTRFRVTNEGADPGTGLLELNDTTRYARLDLWIFDARVLLRPPVTIGRVAPYAILGGGVMQFDVREDGAVIPPEARAGFGSDPRRQWTGVAGVGAVIPLQRKRLLLAFDLTDHLTRTPLRDSDRSTSFKSDNQELVVRPDGDGHGQDGIVLTSNLQLKVGITIPLRLR